jgi:hypothetical protein
MLGVMESTQPIDRVLSRICSRCPHLADEAIELHRGLAQRCTPGRCAKAFFELARSAGSVLPTEVSHLEGVLRKSLAIEVCGPGEQKLEEMGFAPNPFEDLEGYCQRTMHMVFWDRSYSSNPLTLRFCFR